MRLRPDARRHRSAASQRRPAGVSSSVCEHTGHARTAGHRWRRRGVGHRVLPARRGFQCTVLEARSAPASFTTAVAAGGYRLQLEHADEVPLVAGRCSCSGGSSRDRTERACGRSAASRLSVVDHRARNRCAAARTGRPPAIVGVDGVELLSGDAVRERFPWFRRRSFRPGSERRTACSTRWRSPGACSRRPAPR